MWDWERASIPYRPIYLRRLRRRRLVAALLIACVVIPVSAYLHQRAATSVSQRIFDEVASTISLRYYDRSYHGVAWRDLAAQYRTRIVDAPTTAARYAALRELVAHLRDSHTAVYSPDDLQPRRDERHHAVFGMSPDAAAAQGSAIDWRVLKPGIGYLRIGSFPDSIDGLLGWAMTDVGRYPSLILDLRGNPGGLVDSVDAVAGLFLPPGTLISTGTRRYHLFGSQRFVASGRAGGPYAGKLIVLVDANSRSGAESLARALQYYHRATLVGTRTAGKVLGVDVEITLADGGLLRVATLDMRAPDGQRLEGNGVQPDIFVAGRAAQLRTALGVLSGP